MEKVAVKGMAHITGGGLLENIPRVLPQNTQAKLDEARWPRPAIFDWLQRHGHIDRTEMHRTFNCGVGMVLVVAKKDANATIERLKEHGVEAYEIGAIVERKEGEPQAVVV
jgi:phosphoribosylformylglycinamidine cyclo-ligase